MRKGKDQELKALADWLSENQDAILEKWEKRMIETKEKPTQLAAMSRNEFQNDIPEFLDRLCDSLKGKEISFADIGKGHGVQRWGHGFDLLLTIQEWRTLQKILQKEISSFLNHSDLNSPALDKAHKILTNHIQEGIEYSIEEFDQLRQEESKAQLRDLKQALEKPEDISRKHNLRSTSHDLKGIMNNIQIGFRLLKDEDLSTNASEIIDQMVKAADSLEKLLNDLLDLFRLETNREEINLSEFDAAEVLSELCESMQPTAKTEKLDLVYQGAESLPVVNDKKKIERIARNLLLNALKYTKEGHVEVKSEKHSEDHWLLVVSDTGPGLDATHAESLAIDGKSPEADVQNDYSSDEDSVSSRAESHGEGIGLLIVRHLCRLLDATITVDTAPGAGTTFEIIFPLELSE